MGVGRSPEPRRPRTPSIPLLILREALWLLAGTLLAALLLLYLHEEWLPLQAFSTAIVGAIMIRWLATAIFAGLPGWLLFYFHIGVALLGVILACWATLALYPISYWVLRWRPAVALPVAAAIVGLGLGLLRFQQIRFAREIEESQRRLAALREEALRAQLSALQAQINPHFLFNALNALAELTHSDPAAAESLVEDLSFLLRYTMRSAGEGLVTLEQEMAAVDRYLNIEQARLGDRLRVLRDVDGSLAGSRLPGLILQPLVENAVRHAIAARADGGTLRITAARDGELLLLGVYDDGPGLPEEQRRRLDSPAEPVPDGEGSAGAGGGLANVRLRIALGYARRGSLRYRDCEGGGSCLEIRLPLDLTESEGAGA